MPGGDFKGDHNEFVEDEGGEGDSDHFVAVAGGEELGEELDDAALVDGDGDPNEEGFVTQRGAGCEFLVELRVGVGEALVDVFVEDEGEDGRHGVDGGVADEEPVAVEDVWVEVVGDGVEGLGAGENEAAVDDELGEFGRALVGVAAVPDEEFGDVVEVCEGEVGGEGGLAAFFADDADADVGGLDHGDVVAAVADGEDAGVRVGADEEGQVGFLGGGAAAGDYGWEEDGEGDEGRAVVEEEVRERVAVYEEGGGGGFGAEEGEGGGGCGGGGGEGGDGVDVLGAGDEFGGDGDAARGFDFVAREHPDFDAGVAEEFEGGFDGFLEPVFDAGHAEEFDVVLEVGGDDLGHAVVAVEEGERGLLVGGGEVLVLLGGHLFAANDKGSQTFARHVGGFFVEPVVGCYD